jgi:hypothetical protein
MKKRSVIRPKNRTHTSLRFYIGPRQHHTNLNIPSTKTKLIPTLQHPTPKLQPMILHIRHQYTQLPVLSSNLPRVIPLQIVRGAVPHVDGFQVRVVLGVECAVWDFEFVREYWFVGLSVEACACFAESGVAMSISLGTWNLGWTSALVGDEDGKAGGRRVLTIQALDLIRIFPLIARLRELCRMNVRTG